VISRMNGNPLSAASFAKIAVLPVETFNGSGRLRLGQVRLG
jgi:hypothetical protein